MNAPCSSPITVGQICQRITLECDIGDSIAVAAERMHKIKCGSILIKEGPRVVGIWTQKDAMRLDLAGINVLDTPVGRVMSAPVKSIQANASIGDAALEFHRLGVRHLLVTDPSEAPFGIVSYTDVINHQGLDYFVQMREVGSALRGIPLVVSADTPVHEVLAQMSQYGVDAAAVDRDGVMGIFTAADLIGLLRNRQADTTMRSVATFPLLTVAWDSSLYHARFLLMEKRIHHLGVERDGHFAGLLTYNDILECVTSGYLRDLQQTLRSQAEELVSSQRALQLAQKVADTSLQAIMITDGAGRIESLNPAFTAMTGYTREEVLGHNPRILKSGEHDAAFYRQLFDALAQRGMWRGEICNRHKNGQLIQGILTITAVRDSAGGIRNYVGILADITEQKRVAEELRRTRQEIATKDSFLQVVLDSLPISIQVKDAHGRNLLLNESAARLFGFTKHELAGRTGFDVLPEASARLLQEADEQALAEGGTVAREISIEQQGASSRLLVHAHSIKVGDEAVLVSTAVDITSRHTTELRLAQDNQILSMLAQGQAESAILTAICRNLEALLPGARTSVLVLSDDGLVLRHGAAPSLPGSYTDSLDGTAIGPGVGSCRSAIWHRTPVISPDLREDPRWKDFLALAETHRLRACWSVPVIGPDNSVLGTLAAYFNHPRAPRQAEMDVLKQSADVAAIALERGRVISRLHRLATTDALTGMPNRQHFLDLSTHQLRASQRNRDAMALCMIDADHFKRINDELGHAAGDMVLQQLARRLQETLRDGDISGRIGGEEFAILLTAAESPALLQIAERLRQAMVQVPFDLPSGDTRQVTISIGVALHRDEESLQSLMARADQALYAAKQGGRNRVCAAG